MAARFTQRVEGHMTKTNYEFRAHNSNLWQSELMRRADKIASRNVRPHMPHLDEWKQVRSVDILQRYAEIGFEQADKIPIGMQASGVAVGYRVRIEATANGLIRGPVLEDNHNLGINVARGLCVGRDIGTFVSAVMIVSNALVAGPLGTLPLPRKCS